MQGLVFSLGRGFCGWFGSPGLRSYGMGNWAAENGIRAKVQGETLSYALSFLSRDQGHEFARSGF
jgi:hypothetical protein